MKTFISDSFLLHSSMAEKLYHKYADKMPVFDYHCHLNPKDILADRRFQNLTEIWLEEDHYKWRLMRFCGVEEEYITGKADPYEKFLKWARTVPKIMGNPLYHWIHLELKRYFDIDELLNPKTAPEIWKACNEKLSKEEYSVRSLIVRCNIRVLCTTDDPADDLASHLELAGDKSFPVKILPSFRPEKAVNIESKGFAEYMARLSKASGIRISSFGDVVKALEDRAEYFRGAGCLTSDISLHSPDFTKGTMEDAERGLKKSLAGGEPTEAEINAYKRHLLIALGRIYNRLDFCSQLHMGVLRNNNSRMYPATGPDAGFDAMGDGVSARSLISLLDTLDKTCELPKTIIYGLDENDHAKILSIIGCYQGGGLCGKLQLGSAWWFNDHIEGIRRQLSTLASMGALGSFIGMLTDSRSFLSCTRHEYFRRILCDLIGRWAENGEVPYDEELLGGMVQDICFYNAVRYFGLKL
ncbi:MAG TPA: glucuronate isomerase [Ruminiclostridium sp.]|nr:glucuronate isomerase [Ruminiclostridium sp.]